MSDPGFGEQTLNRVAEIGISSQLDEVTNLHVHIKTDPFKLLQGQVDEVTIDGEGLVMQKDLRVEEIEMHMDAVAINPFSAAFGKIELTKPTDASTRVVLTETDINRAFNSDYVHKQLKSQKVHIAGQEMAVTLQHIDFRLPGDGKVALSANILLPDGKTEQVAFSAVPHITGNGQTISLDKVEYSDTQESPLTKALIEQTSEILNLSNFDLAGMSLRVQNFTADVGKLTLHAQAHVDHMPT